MRDSEGSIPSDSMKVWISGEVDAQTGDAFQRAMMRVETLLNEALESQNY